jgi:serine/threonine protein kinase
MKWGAKQAIDFLEKCLTFSPKRRIEVGEALQHPYLAVSAWLRCNFDVEFVGRRDRYSY